MRSSGCERVSVTRTPSEHEGLSEVRAGVLRQPGLVGAGLRSALADAYDAWLRALADRVAGGLDGAALAAVGGLGRREPAPCGDLDLVLLYNGRAADVSVLADKLWYPIWDGGLDLDHSVRTPDQALAVAKDDLKAMLGMLDLRHLAGDGSITEQLRQRVLDLWRATASKRVPELRELSVARWDVAGEAAFLLEPNLKESRGGLRDAQSLQALAAAQLADLPIAVRGARTVLLDIRAELQRRTGRNDDVLRKQEHAGVSEALGWAEADDVLRQVNQAARTVSLAVDGAWRRVAAQRPPSRGLSPMRLLGPLAPAASPPSRVGLAQGVVRHDGEVVLARDADPWADPGLVFRAARVAAEQDLPLSPFTLERLASESAPLPVPWPPAALAEFVSLLGTGARAVPVLESLDQAGLLAGLFPEWDAVRYKIQHNPVHRFTVDRHLLEAAAQAAPLVRQVDRADLLLVGALLHDIGKGFAGDHSLVGAPIAGTIAARMGFSYGDTATIIALVRHHLLLPDTATRRDLDDPMTITTVADAVSRSAELLDLLHALTIADAQATGPQAWSEWKARLISDLVRRTRSLLNGGRLPGPPPLDSRRQELAETGDLAVLIEADEVVVAAPDGLGVLSRTAGVLALHSLDVRSAAISTHAGMAVNSFVVEPRFGNPPEASLVRADLALALAGSLRLSERLAAKERSYSRGGGAARRPPSIHWFDDAATDATVLELRADDAIGLLYRVTAMLERLGLDIRSARVSSLGGSVVDAFYLTDGSGLPVPVEARSEVESSLSEI
jgi:[protein-PII] uridylyltransferase